MDCMATYTHHAAAFASEMKCEDVCVCVCLCLEGGGIQRMLEGGGDEGDGKGDAWCLILMSRSAVLCCAAMLL